MKGTTDARLVEFKEIGLAPNTRTRLTDMTDMDREPEKRTHEIGGHQ